MAKDKQCDGVNDPMCVERFWAKVGPPNERGCRTWTASRAGKKKLYGQFAGGPLRKCKDGATRRVHVLAHRFAWVLEHGPIPDGILLRHTCDVHACCEASHLVTGDQVDNVSDTQRRFVAEDGAEGAGRPKLTHAEAAEVYRLAWAGVLQLEIAARFGIGATQVSKIKLGQRRSHSVREATAA